MKRSGIPLSPTWAPASAPRQAGAQHVLTAAVQRLQDGAFEIIGKPGGRVIRRREQKVDGARQLAAFDHFAQLAGKSFMMNPVWDRWIILLKYHTSCEIGQSFLIGNHFRALLDKSIFLERKIFGTGFFWFFLAGYFQPFEDIEDRQRLCALANPRKTPSHRPVKRGYELDRINKSQKNSFLDFHPTNHREAISEILSNNLKC